MMDFFMAPDIGAPAQLALRSLGEGGKLGKT
jgi:hypothetical protein